MYKTNLDVIGFEKWNRKILKIYWLTVLIAAITEIIIFFLVAVRIGNGNFGHFASYVIRPTVINVILFGAVEIIFHYIKDKHKEVVKYLIIIAGTLLVCNMVYIHYAVSVIYVLFIFPIMLTVFYGSKKIMRFALTINLICYILMAVLYLPTVPQEKLHHNITDFCTTIAFISIVALIVSSFIDRSEEILNSLVGMQQREEELAIKNFVMEFNSKMEPATGLYNHKTFHEYLGYLIQQSEGFGFSLSLAVIDIDNFKRVNDTYGHSLGDEVIKALAELIKNSIGTDDYAARYGGEEFAIIFTDKDKYKTFEIVENIRKKFNGIIIDGMKSENFSISIGVSEHTKGMTKETFFTNADNALYQAKKGEKNKTVIYEVNK